MQVIARTLNGIRLNNEEFWRLPVWISRAAEEATESEALNHFGHQSTTLTFYGKDIILSINIRAFILPLSPSGDNSIHGSKKTSGREP